MNQVRVEDFCNYEVYIATELANEGYRCYLIYCDKSSFTKRVFYVTEFDGMSYYINNGDFPTSDYFIAIKTEHTQIYSRYYDIIKHIQGKNWFNLDYLDDSMTLMDHVRQDKDLLIEHSLKFNNKILKELYFEKRGTFSKYIIKGK